MTDQSSGYSQVLKATAGNTTVYYTRGFELISRREGDAASFYLYDGGLSVRALTDTTGAITDTLVFDAFGNETEKTGTTANTYGFQGEEQDATGLYYLRARYMDPASGTFTSMDTYAGSLSDPMSLHKYLFANSNPVMYSDPSGHYTLTEQETAIAIQAILGEAISGIVYIFDWFITDPDSKNHSIGKMIIAMMLGLARSAVMGSWGGLLSGLISKAGMSVLDYLLTGIMFALFSGNLKLAAINLRESGNFKVAAICNAGGAFADFVAFCSVINAVSTYAASKADNKSSKAKKYRNNKRGAIRIGGNNTDSTNTSGLNNADAGNSIENPVPIEGKGSTGRTIPNNINEQVAMQQVRSNPLDGAVDLSKVSKKPVILRDGRWKASDGWVKMSNTVNGIEIHFVYNTITGAFDDFKFV